jgi:hypothetical protein
VTGSKACEAGGANQGVRTCAVCAAETAAVFDYLVQRQHRIVTVAAERQAFGSSRGFCSFHLWLLRQIGDSLSLSKALEPVARAWAEEIRSRRLGGIDDATAALAAAIPEADSCPACEVQREAGTEGVRALLQRLADHEHAVRVGGEVALCLRHLVAVLRGRPPADAARRLLEEYAARLDAVASEMRAYEAKREALQRELITEVEHDAWRRALELLAGERPLRSLERGDMRRTKR